MSAALRTHDTKPLRDYQWVSVTGVRKAARTHRRVVLVAPTGSGKTRMGAELVHGAVSKGSPVLWVAHRTELIDQTCATLESLGLEVGAIAAKSAWERKPAALVQVASIQTLLARGVRPPAKLVIWDECHHASEAAEEWSSILDAYKDVHAVGLTATPERSDGSGLSPLFTGLVVATSVRKLTESGFLVPCEIVRPESVLKPNHLAQHPLDVYKANAAGQQGLLFARSVDEAVKFAAEFCAADIEARVVHAKTPDAERQAIIAGFRAGTVRMLCNVYVFTEGTDLPMASVCILARGASTAGIYLQMVGRVLRPHSGKKSATLIDLRGISHVHGPPEDERVYSLDGRGISRAQAKCKVCGALLADYPCGECGYAPECGEGEETASEIDGVDVHKFARKIAEGPAQRDETAIRWVKQALLKGWNPKAVRHKWRAVYGEDMGEERYAMALRAQDDATRAASKVERAKRGAA